MAMAYFARAAADNVVHAEIFFDPQTHTERGVAVRDGDRRPAPRAATRARRELGITRALILCFLRHLSEDDGARHARSRRCRSATHFIGVGLDCGERGHPPEKFARVFARAGELGLHRVAHAGEEGPPAYICERARRAGGRAHRPRRALPRGPGAGASGWRASGCRSPCARCPTSSCACTATWPQHHAADAARRAACARRSTPTTRRTSAATSTTTSSPTFAALPQLGARACLRARRPTASRPASPTLRQSRLAARLDAVFARD